MAQMQELLEKKPKNCRNERTRGHPALIVNDEHFWVVSRRCVRVCVWRRFSCFCYYCLKWRACVANRGIRIWASTWVEHSHTLKHHAHRDTVYPTRIKRESPSERTWSCYSSILLCLFLFRLASSCCVRRLPSTVPMCMCAVHSCATHGWMDGCVRVSRSSLIGKNLHGLGTQNVHSF